MQGLVIDLPGTDELFLQGVSRPLNTSDFVFA
jgi:hypothetical protein